MGWAGHHVLRGLAGCLSSTERAAKLGCFGLKFLVGTGTPEGNTFKNSGHREGMRAVVQELLCKNNN